MLNFFSQNLCNYSLFGVSITSFKDNMHSGKISFDSKWVKIKLIKTKQN